MTVTPGAIYCPCGRLGLHDPHHWQGNLRHQTDWFGGGRMVRPNYWCSGNVKVEGGNPAARKDKAVASRRERIADYQNRAEADVKAVLREYGISAHGRTDEFFDALVEDLVSVVMHPVEQLVLEATR